MSVGFRSLDPICDELGGKSTNVDYFLTFPGEKITGELPASPVSNYFILFHTQIIWRYGVTSWQNEPILHILYFYNI